MESISKAIDEGTKRGINHGWVWQIPRKRRRRYVVKVLGRNLRKFCENSSLVGYRYLVEPNRSWIERAIWVILQVSTLCMLGMLVNSFYEEYHENPVVTIVDSYNYPSHQLEFPGINALCLQHGISSLFQEFYSVCRQDVRPRYKKYHYGIAICNINRISRKTAMKLANEIVSANITDWEAADLLRLIKQLSNLYQEEYDANVNSEKYLNEILKEYYKDDYDITTLMRDVITTTFFRPHFETWDTPELSPNCEDAFTSCHFQGEAQNCSDIFVFRKTQHGFCCTFNYAREFDDILNIDDIKKEEQRQPYYINSLGLTNGLSLVMEPFIEDYYYPIFPIIGWKITVFNARDYPDNGSGSVSEALVSPATETFIELDVTSFYSTDEIRKIEIKKRKCIFQNEIPVLYTGYTYSDCLVDCRAAAVLETCKCRPFYLPRRGNDQYKQDICNTGDSACLYKYRKVYWTVLSSKVEDLVDDDDSYKLSMETIEQCRNCYPACNDVRYYLHSSTAYLNSGTHDTELLNNVQLGNQSIVHIYFTKHGCVRLKQDISYYWYDLLSNIGGICGVFIGFSLISVVEFFYFMLCTLIELWRGNTRITSRRRTMRMISRRMLETSGINKTHFTGTLYWNEFLSHSRLVQQNQSIQTWRH